MAAMISDRIKDLCICVHSAAPPSRAEWNAMIDTIKPIPVQKLRILVLTDGGGPDGLQRGQLIDYLAGAHPRIAVVSDSLAVRGIVTAISWFSAGIRFFPPNAFATAYAYLDLPELSERHVRERVRAAADKLTGAELKAVSGL